MLSMPAAAMSTASTASSAARSKVATAIEMAAVEVPFTPFMKLATFMEPVAVVIVPVVIGAVVIALVVIGAGLDVGSSIVIAVAIARLNIQFASP